MGAPDIYVQIPSYRDGELPSTLRSLYAKAARPERLRVRVAWQHGPEEALPGDVLALPGVEVDAIDARVSQGCNWARLRLQQAWRGEPYTLLLDSHHRFVRHWDTLALRMIDQLSEGGVVKPLLTGYLPNYLPDHEPRARGRRPFKIYPYGREEGILTRLTSMPIIGWSKLDAPTKADFVSLHFILTGGAFNEEVPFDPEIYFFGDEVLTSVRAFASGYQLFHPHRVIGWHAYDRSRRVPHWDEHDDWTARHRCSLDRMRQTYLSTGPVPGVPHALRTVADFEDEVNVALVLP